MSFFDTFCEMLVILFAIAMGFLANKLNILGGEVDQKLCKLLLTITVPALTVGSVISGSSLPDTGTILSVLWVAVLFYGLELVIALFAPRLLGGNTKTTGGVAVRPDFFQLRFYRLPCGDWHCLDRRHCFTQ